MFNIQIWLNSFVKSRRATRRRPTIRPGVEHLEDRSLPSVVFTIDPQQNVHAISRFIYGVNQNLDGSYSSLTFTRLGGNRWTAYNWENNASNAGSDWMYQNDSYLGGGSTPGGAMIPTLQNAAAHNAGTLLTVPINGYVSADKNGDGDVRNSGSNYLQTRFRQELASKGSALSLTPNLNDGYVYEDEFVNWVKTNFPYGETDPNRPIWFELDNEPDLWAETHAEVHPNAATYAELVQKSIAYANAIKNVAAGTQVFGPVNYGWNGYTTLQDAPDAAGRDFLNFYLQQMQQAETTYSKRLLDVMDVHWYPEATGGGIRITGQDTTAAVVAARLQAPRSLWDPTYTETSWITQWSTMGPIDLLPRLQGKIAQNYAGTKLAITEYNYGGGADISGGIAEADVLGIFGREGLYAANEWALAQNESFIAGAFQMYRNFDGQGGTFGDTSIKASTSDVANSSVYASIDSTNPNVMIVVAINKTGQAQPATLQLSHVAPGATATAYKLTSGSANPQSAGQFTISDPSNFSYTMPAYSVTTMRIALSSSTNAAPTVSVPAAAAPSTVTGTTTALSVLGADDGGETNLTYTWSTSAKPAGAASPTFLGNGNNAAKNATATFFAAGNYTFLVTISDGSLSTTSSVNVTVKQTLTSISVTPAMATATTGSKTQFTATARDQFGATLSAPPTFAWSVVSGGGTISALGLYTAPGAAGAATIQASSGGFSGTATVTVTVPPPAAPTSLTYASRTRTQINLAWRDKSNNEMGFLIEMSLDGKTFTQIASAAANSTRFLVLGLTPNTRYYFRVRAWNDGGVSNYSNVLSTVTKR